MPPADPSGLSAREREIMDIVHERRLVTVREVADGLPNAPSESAVRTMLARLEQKGHLKRKEQGRRFVFVATMPRNRARHQALSRVVRIFFDSSVEQAVAALLSSSKKISPEELERISKLIEDKRSEQS